MTQKDNCTKDLGIDLGNYHISLRHHPVKNFDMWVARFVTDESIKTAEAEQYELCAFSQKDLAVSFLPWLGGIAANSSEHEQACFEVLHRIEELLPQAIIEEIMNNYR